MLALDGIPITKVVARGWLSAALSHERDVYLWGGRLGARERWIGAERDIPAEQNTNGEQSTPTNPPPSDNEDDVQLLHAPAGADVADVAVGDGWVVIVTAGGTVWGCGEGQWGQLGTGRRGWEREWVEGRVEGWEGEGAEGWVEGGQGRNREGEGRIERGNEGERRTGKRVIGVEAGIWNCFLLVKL